MDAQAGAAGGSGTQGAGLKASVYRQAASRPRLLLVLFCLALWLPGFFTLPPGDRDESRFAQATKQMNETGDYVRIMNGTVPRNRKPIGIYWLQAPFARAAGPGLANPIWPYRIPSLLGGIAAVLATFEAGLLLTPTRRTAALAAAMLAACTLLTTETHIAKTDAALLAATTWSMVMLARAWTGVRITSRQAALFWLALAAGVLLKGPITPMVVALAAATLCLWEGRAAWLASLRPAWGAPLMLAAILPWFMAIGLATNGRFFTDAISGDLGSKLGGGSETHGAPPGLHLLLLPLLTFPSSLPVASGLALAWARRHNRSVRFLIAWLLPAWLVFEAVPTKLPHYTLPLYPALFLLAACTFGHAVPKAVRVAGTAGLAAATLILTAAALVLPVALHDSWWRGIPPALAATLAGWLALRRRAVLALCACIPLYWTLLQVELPDTASLWIGPRVVNAVRTALPDSKASGSGIAITGYAEPSLVFLLGTKVQLLYSGAQAAAALQSKRANLVLVSDGTLPDFVSASARLGFSPRPHGSVGGFNPSRGRWVTLYLETR